MTITGNSNPSQSESPVSIILPAATSSRSTVNEKLLSNVLEEVKSGIKRSSPSSSSEPVAKSSKTGMHELPASFKENLPFFEEDKDGKVSLP